MVLHAQYGVLLWELLCADDLSLLAESELEV